MSLSEREGVSQWVWGGEESPTAVPFERKKCRRVFLIREAGGRVLKGPWSVEESSSGSSFGSNCLESSKLHVWECVLLARWTCVYHVKICMLSCLAHVKTNSPMSYHSWSGLRSTHSDIQSLLSQLWYTELNHVHGHFPSFTTLSSQNLFLSPLSPLSSFFLFSFPFFPLPLSCVRTKQIK